VWKIWLATALSTAVVLEIPESLFTCPKATRELVFLSESLRTNELFATDFEILGNDVTIII
jgi:hypothetical protein